MANSVLNKEELDLLSRFNNRDSSAFCTVYNYIYNDLQYYAAVVYQNSSVMPSDIIHDLFINLWSNQSLRFESILNIKVYLFSAIKNSFINYLKHNKIEDKYRNYLTSYDNSEIDIDIVESELYCAVEEAMNLLPQECSDVLKLLIDGWNADDIANKLGKQKQTIYNTKNKAINILRKKLSKDKIYFIFSIIGKI